MGLSCHRKQGEGSGDWETEAYHSLATTLQLLGGNFNGSRGSPFLFQPGFAWRPSTQGMWAKTGLGPGSLKASTVALILGGGARRVGSPWLLTTWDSDFTSGSYCHRGSGARIKKCPWVAHSCQSTLPALPVPTTSSRCPLSSLCWSFYRIQKP